MCIYTVYTSLVELKPLAFVLNIVYAGDSETTATATTHTHAHYFPSHMQTTQVIILLKNFVCSQINLLYCIKKYDI